MELQSLVIEVLFYAREKPKASERETEKKTKLFGTPTEAQWKIETRS
ncbi:hypothetical protein J31TS6_05940 [Brevibacillus reuszeri]|nr:hypothetical protein J31TS6_05940 [Brevibacillus reuszeri]